ncbi:MAG: type I-D CRISPR-associated protein Cas10d/Csc3 [Candidatus Vecturithrix sp.]|nr:type I-D CRISPR-associated protein Cas10d/Csc3 [Candidatus Vecturithrix sp.]
MPVQIRLLLDSVDPEDAVLREYVRLVAPNLLTQLATYSAKGGKAFLEKCRREGYKYHDKPDQSMAAHVLNGIFPVMRIVRELERRDLHTLNDTERKLYLTAYTLHDLDKIAGEKDLYHLGTSETREHLTQALTAWIKRLAIDQFFPEYESFFEDLIYLILNTQDKYGTDALPYNYGVGKLAPRKRDFLRDLSNLSDVLNYLDDKQSDGNLLTSPACVCQGKLQKLLARLSQGQLRFAYHQLSTVTGLLTNLINNAILHLFRERGYVPLLFFPNGVVYLADNQQSVKDIADQLFETVTKKISSECKQRLQHNQTGFTRDGKGMKFSHYYHNIFSVPELLNVAGRAVNKIIHDKKKPVSAERIAAMRQMQKEGGKWGIPAEIELNGEASLDTDRLAEYLMVVEQVLSAIPEITGVYQKIINSLELADEYEYISLIPDKGGTKYRWYLAAGKYLQHHPGLDREELNAAMATITQAVIDIYRPQIEQHESQRESFSFLRSYLQAIVDLDGTAVQGQQDFGKELEMYSSAHKSGRKTLMCSLCSTPYTTDRQQETAVLFQPQVYTNKQPLNKQADRRGICDICSLELMLRQILMKSRFQASGGNFENLKVKYLYLYPGYYFATETARYVARFYDDSLKRLNLFKVTNALTSSQAFSIQNLLELEDFQIETEDDDEENGGGRFLKMELPKNDLATFFFFGIPSFEKEPTETESWIIPAFLALALSFVLTAKVVASECPLPLYANGNEFRETVILDAPHHFLMHILEQDRFRIDEVFKKLETLTAVFRMHLDVYSSKGKPNWNRINEIAANLDTDRMYVFHYLMKLQRGQKWESLPRSVVTRYLHLYQLLQREGDMSIFKGLVNRYYVFYHPADFNSHNILRPVSTAIALTIKSDTDLSEEDAILEMIGEIKGSQERVHNKQAKGYAPIGGYDELAAIREFVEYFYHETFQGYCRGERALLRERANRIKSGCEAYYLENYAPRKKNKDVVNNTDADA